SGVLVFGLVPQSGLYGLFAAILVLSAYQMLQPRRELAEHDVSASHPWAAFDGAYPDGPDGRHVPYRVERLPLGMGLMYGAGLASAGAYMARGLVAPLIAGPVVLGSVLGAALGAHLMLRLSSERLRIFFVAVLVLLALEMLIKAFGIDLRAVLHG